MVAIIDYGLGNLGSIANMLKIIGEKSIITSNADEIRSSSKIILSGVGAFDAGISQLENRGLISLIEGKQKMENQSWEFA